jgi:ribokinase
MRSDWDVIVMGGANIDYLVRGHHLPRPGEQEEGHEFHQSFGGKGVNQAVAAVRMGARVALIAALGDQQDDDHLLAYLEEEGVDTRFVKRKTGATCGRVLIHVDQNGRKQSLDAPGANLLLSAADIPEDAFTGVRVALTQFGVPLPAVQKFARLAQDSGARLILDPSPPIEPPGELCCQVEILKPNAVEAEALTGIPVRGMESARKAARILLAHGVKMVALPAGEDGNLFIWEGGESLHPLFDIQAVDTTGAGDAFAGALGTALAEGLTIEEAGEMASAAAALATTRLGVQAALPRRKQVQYLMETGQRVEETVG